MNARAAARLARRLAAEGFLGLGGFHPQAGDAVPALADGRPCRTVLLIGSAGPALWQAFRAAPEYADGAPDPLDRHTRRVLGATADSFGMSAVFPFERPYPPFQAWALRAGGFSRSPLGVLAHARYGPWAAFRAAFLSGERFGDFAAAGEAGPCEVCPDRACLAACPAGAVTPAGYEVPACTAHLAAHPDSSCHHGCRARMACPVGTAYRPGPDHARFHMRAFLTLATPPADGGRT